MKYLILAGGFVATLSVSQMIQPAHAQSHEVRSMCTAKYGLGKNAATASEAQRKEAAAKIAACIRSGGKS